MKYDQVEHFFIFPAEPPKGPSDLCPRLNGFYAHPDPNVCNIFYACVEGTAEEYTCSPGLWFDEFRGVCNWPTETERTSCSAGNNLQICRLCATIACNELFLYVYRFIAAHQVSENGFKCPENAAPKADGFGLSDPHPKYADPSDCAKFYICLNGVTPREQGCELGLVYNENTQSCDSPKNVPEW